MKKSHQAANKPEVPVDYSIRSVVRACDILKCFDRGDTALALSDVAERTGLSRPTAYRLLQTLVSCGMLDILAKNSYAISIKRKQRQKYRFGYASQTEEFSFSRLVSESIRSSAYDAGIDLLVLNNCYSPKTAIRNAEIFVREQVDLVIEFQTNQQSASVVASKLMEAGIPIIAIEIPHPGAAYYGANNYRAGVIGGHALAQACIREWKGVVDEILLLELPMAGPLPRSRLTGMLAGIREQLQRVPDQKVRFVDGNGRFEKSLDVIRKHLRRSTSQHILLGALNDPSCLGALSAFEEAGRAEHCLAVGHNASIEARKEMRRPGSRLVGSVGFFPERYGDAVISLAMDKVQGKEIPSASFIKHQLITSENVNSFYPHDGLIDSGDGDSLLFSRS
ncbi:substrate-binding domain-containing protein [Edaphobacter sp. HDX4]|uniref:substrate-binding domain-containing protein n=1 Tax=Edaphobacter sp. HDX4 TaxID=2794064 RepID=UPI002FE62379